MSPPLFLQFTFKLGDPCGPGRELLFGPPGSTSIVLPCFKFLQRRPFTEAFGHGGSGLPAERHRVLHVLGPLPRVGQPRSLRTLSTPILLAAHPLAATTHAAAASPSVAATTAAVAADRALVVADRAGFRLAPRSERSARGGARPTPNLGSLRLDPAGKSATRPGGQVSSFLTRRRGVR